ncbi:hypothetical protein M3J09_013783 [Ascochyta lentis]
MHVNKTEHCTLIIPLSQPPDGYQTRIIPLLNNQVIVRGSSILEQRLAWNTSPERRKD